MLLLNTLIKHTNILYYYRLLLIEFLTGAVDMTEPQVQQMIAKFVTDNINGFTTEE